MKKSKQRKPSYERSCLGKIRFETYSDAKVSALNLSKRGGLGYVQPYQCLYCGGFHCGHPIKRK